MSVNYIEQDLISVFESYIKSRIRGDNTKIKLHQYSVGSLVLRMFKAINFKYPISPYITTARMVPIWCIHTICS